MRRTQWFLVFLFLVGYELGAEPWLANRYGQNCAACHAPGRWNVEPKKRRCTLSCQGCHVNPNGGGLRDSYGKWNQQRWLKSFHIEGSVVSRLRPAKNQAYIKEIAKKEKETVKHGVHLESDKGKGQDSIKPSLKKPSLAIAQKKEGPSVSFAGQNQKAKQGVKQEAKTVGPTLSLDSDLDHPTISFDKHSDLAWKTNVDAKTFMDRVPVGDPWRQERQSTVFAGADLRYFFGHLSRRIKKEGAPDRHHKLNLQGLMNVDIGVQFKPVRENLSFVIENRFSNGPSRGSHYLERGFTSHSRVRSAYGLYEDFSYNSWWMAGLYRPMFGHYNPDHESLSNRITGLDQKAVFKSLGFGTAPNVPFFNIHWIMPTEGNNFSPEEGLNINMGGRFVTYSLSVKGSYWKTQLDREGEKVDKELYALTAGGLLGDLTLNVEFLRFSERRPLSLNRGNVYTLDTKYRVWRENYMVLNWALSNTALSKNPGQSSEVGFGYKGYWLSGLKLELLYVIRENQEDSPQSKHLGSDSSRADPLFFLILGFF